MNLSVLRRNSGTGWSVSSRVELALKRFAKSSALSLEDVNTSGPLKRGGITDFLLLLTLLIIRQKFREPIFWEAIWLWIWFWYDNLASLITDLQWFLASEKRSLLAVDWSRWYWWKKWFLWAIAAAQAGENQGDEWGLTWNFREGMNAEMPDDNQDVISSAHFSAGCAKTSVQGTSRRKSRKLSQ